MLASTLNGKYNDQLPNIAPMNSMPYIFKTIDTIYPWNQPYIRETNLLSPPLSASGARVKLRIFALGSKTICVYLYIVIYNTYKLKYMYAFAWKVWKKNLILYDFLFNFLFRHFKIGSYDWKSISLCIKLYKNNEKYHTI